MKIITLIFLGISCITFSQNGFGVEYFQIFGRPLKPGQRYNLFPTDKYFPSSTNGAGIYYSHALDSTTSFEVGLNAGFKIIEETFLNERGVAISDTSDLSTAFPLYITDYSTNNSIQKDTMTELSYIQGNYFSANFLYSKRLHRNFSFFVGINLIVCRNTYQDYRAISQYNYDYDTDHTHKRTSVNFMYDAQKNQTDIGFSIPLGFKLIVPLNKVADIYLRSQIQLQRYPYLQFSTGFHFNGVKK